MRLLAQFFSSPLSIEAVLSLFSLTVTSYFWFVKARRERPSLQFYQMRDFRASVRNGDPERNTKRLSLTQVDEGGVLIANNSTRQNSIVRFDCYFQHDGQRIKGSWGFMEDERFPWNIAPESAIGVRLACFFDVPEDFEVPENTIFGVEFITVGGRRFRHTFSLNAPQI